MTLDPIPYEDEIKSRPFAGLTTKVVKGSFWTLASQVLPLGISVIVTPFIIRFLGTEGYGAMIIVGLTTTYLGFADFGMSIASTKFAAQAYADRDPNKEANIIRTAVVITLMSSIPFATIIFVLSTEIIEFLNVPSSLAMEASVALKLASITFVASMANGVLNTPQLTRLRMDLNSLVNAGFRILGLISTPVVLYYGGGLVGVFFVLLAVSLFTLAGHIFVSGRLLPQLYGLNADRSMIGQLLKFGGALSVGSIAVLLLSNLEKGVLPRFVSVKELAYYSVAFTFASMMTLLSSAMIQSLIPAFSLLQGKDRQEQLRDLYNRGIRITVICLIPALVFLSIIARPFFTFWAGEDFGRESLIPFYVLLVGLVFNIPAFLPYGLIMSSGRTDTFLKLYFAELVPYFFLVTLLVYYFGAIGAAVAWSVRMIIDAILLFSMANVMTVVSFKMTTISRILGSGAIMLVPLFLSLYTGGFGLAVFAAFLVCVVIYLFLLWKSVIENTEKKWLEGKVQLCWNRLDR